MTVSPAAVAVRVVIPGTVLAMMFSVLGLPALVKAVIVPELVRLTTPLALFVMPVIAPEPLRFSVSALMNLASAVVMVVPVKLTVPLFVNPPAVVPMEHVPPRVSLQVFEFVNDPLAPASAVPIVNAPLLFVYEPETVTLGIEIAVVPPIVFVAPASV
jgi:hypothetical protein